LSDKLLDLGIGALIVCDKEMKVMLIVAFKTVNLRSLRVTALATAIPGIHDRCSHLPHPVRADTRHKASSFTQITFKS
jgi:hypothetical protein